MSGISLLPFIVVFLILFTLAFGIIVAVIIAQYLKERKGNRIRPKVSCKQIENFFVGHSMITFLLMTL